jgi:hypothetical protein
MDTGNHTMSETMSPTRIEPIVDPGPSAAGTGREVAIAPAPAGAGPSSLAEQLARLEDKTARIEEKLSRSESFTARVIDRFEASSHRMSEVAQHSELMAVRSETKFIARRIRALPGFAALVATGAITAVATTILLVLIIRFMPGLIGK